MDQTRFIPERINPQLQAQNAREQIRFVPHIIMMRELERLDEAVSERRDPWRPFAMFTSTLDAWADEDELFIEDWNRAVEKRNQIVEERGFALAYEEVALLRTPYIRLMRRLGVFEKLDKRGGTELDDLRAGGP